MLHLFDALFVHCARCYAILLTAVIDVASVRCTVCSLCRRITELLHKAGLLHLFDALFVHCAFGTKNIIASMVCPDSANLPVFCRLLLIRGSRFIRSIYALLLACSAFSASSESSKRTRLMAVLWSCLISRPHPSQVSVSASVAGFRWSQ